MTAAAGLGYVGLAHPLAHLAGRAALTAHRTVVTVVDDGGRPVPGATLVVGKETTVANGDGTAALDASSTQIATAAAGGRATRTFAVHPGRSQRVVLAGSRTRALRFAGVVEGPVAGAATGPTAASSPSGTPSPSGISTHRAVTDETSLDGVSPLLADAASTAAVVDGPISGAGRGGGTAAAMLARAGITVVDLATPHPGALTDSVTALDAARVAHVGVGRTDEEAWRPLVVKGVSYIACTLTVRAPVPDVQSMRPAVCSASRLAQVVHSERASGRAVAVMLAGGAVATEGSLADDAATAGASVVVGDLPVGATPATMRGTTLVATALGHLTTPRPTATTQSGMILRADVDGVRPVVATFDPLVATRTGPSPAPADVAVSLARRAVAPGQGSVDAGSAALGVPTPRQIDTTHVRARTITRIAPGWEPVTAPAGTLAGVDLLAGAGAFEDESTRAGETGGWSRPASSRVTNTAACSTTGQGGDDVPDEHGIELVRSPRSRRPVVAGPPRRLPVAAGQQLTLALDLRHLFGPGRAELLWYSAVTGRPVSVTSVDLPSAHRGAGGCRVIGIDASVPAGIAYVEPQMRLLPTDDVIRGARMAVDDIALYAWAPLASVRPDAIRSSAAGGATFARTGSAPSSEVDGRWPADPLEVLTARPRPVSTHTPTGNER